MRTNSSPGAIAVALDGTPADRAVLAWAAEEAERESRPLLLAHAAGHLPPEMTYAERHLTRDARKAHGERLLAEAAEFLHRLVPAVPVTTAVRLLHPDALLPAVARDAVVVVRATPAWEGGASPKAQAVVAAVNDARADAHVVEFAAGYAARRGLDLTVLENKDMASMRVLERTSGTALLLLPRPCPTGREPGYSWPVALEVVRRSTSPVAVLSGSPTLAVATA